jgi:hypothetical protein
MILFQDYVQMDPLLLVLATGYPVIVRTILPVLHIKCVAQQQVVA